jgi:penicillin-binding protein 1A
LCAELKKDVQAILESLDCRKTDGTQYNIYRDGLRIYTTIDPKYQRHAEAAMAEHMKKMQQRFFQVWRNRDPWTYRTAQLPRKKSNSAAKNSWKLIRSSDRYQQLWPKYFSPLADRIQDKYEFELQDADMLRMLADEKDGKTITRFVANNWIPAQMAANYRQIMEQSRLAGDQKTMGCPAKRHYGPYRTRVPMKVFSWDSPKPGKRHPHVALRQPALPPHVSANRHAGRRPHHQRSESLGGRYQFQIFQVRPRAHDAAGGLHLQAVRIYATAIAQQSISPCYQVYDQAVTIPAHYQNFTTIADWTPRNSMGSYSGKLLTLKEALKGSVNSVSAFLMKQMGSTEPVRGLLNNMGIDPSARRPDGGYRIPKQPSICLGVADLTVWEMTAAYATFANKGLYARPFVIEKIEDKNGRVIYRAHAGRTPGPAC